MEHLALFPMFYNLSPKPINSTRLFRNRISTIIAIKYPFRFFPALALWFWGITRPLEQHIALSGVKSLDTR